MTDESVTRTAREPTPTSRSRGPTVPNAPGSTTIALMGIVVGGIVMAVFLPIMKLQEALTPK